MIELTEEQALVMEQQQDPLQVINPRTREVFVVIRQEIYALTSDEVSEQKNTDPIALPVTSIPEMSESIWLALAALRRDLPELMANRKTRGKYVCYRRDQRVAVGKNYRSVIAEVVRLNIPEDEYIVEKVQPGAGSVEEEELDRSFLGNPVGLVEEFGGVSRRRSLIGPLSSSMRNPSESCPAYSTTCRSPKKREKSSSTVSGCMCGPTKSSCG